MESVLDLEAARLRQMSASQKIAVMHSLWRQAWSLKAAGVRGQHPDWSPEQVEAAVRENFRDVRSSSHSLCLDLEAGLDPFARLTPRNI